MTKKQFTIPAFDYCLTGNLRAAKIHTVYITLVGQAVKVRRWGGGQAVEVGRCSIMHREEERDYAHLTFL